MLAALTLAGLEAIGSSSFGSLSLSAGQVSLQKVEAPTVAQAPEAVSEPAAEEKSPGRKRAERDGEGPVAPPPGDPTMYLTIPKLGLYKNTVYNDSSPATLDLGAAKIPSTGFPWQDNANTYIAGHRIGYAGTESYYQFYELPSMQRGDEVILEDANGSIYKYKVTEVFAVMPWETWVTNPVPGKDMVTLQTCVASLNDWWSITPGLLTSPPGPETARLIVRAERVSVDPAT
ncbi:hypothetical protein RxyAA322_23260 [Rubrobacter xylanophilus]|uniref:Sortase n=1 Tax=Rubrobacter xylanophilus TaxID=49319 RepID=A0A510HKH3_9ACTN|nr:hypothetical protein RxyAA322_23260 [Rubrobacter xylanophilus]